MSFETTIKLKLKGGSATPGPPVGTALGSKGLNTRKFCEQFNAQSQDKRGKLLRVDVHVRADKTFDIVIKNTPTTTRIKEEANITKGSSEPNRTKVGTLSHAAVDKLIAEMGDELKGFTKEAKTRIIAGTARSMGVQVK